MNRTVKEISKALGTNKDVVYRIIEKCHLEPVPNDNPKEPKRYSDESNSIIKKEFHKLQEKHGTNTTMPGNSSDNSELVLFLQKQIDRYETEIDRLNSIIEDKDATIKELTDKLTKTVESNHLETIRYQELFAREQTTKLLTAQAQTRFNLFKPSTWKKHKAAETPDLEPLTSDEQ